MGFFSTCVGGILKWTFVIINLIFFLCGGVIMGIGIWLAVDSSGLTAHTWDIPSVESAGTLWAVAVYTSIAIGGLMFIICFFGCCGAMAESTCMLYTYNILIGFCIAGQLAFAICAVIFQGEIGEAVQNDMTESVQTRFEDENATDPENPTTSYLWNFFQVELECCGSTGHTDYVNSNFYNTTGLPVPWSCCTMKDGAWGLEIGNVKDLDQCRAEAVNPTPTFTYLNEPGCFTVVNDWTDRYVPVLFGVGFGLAIINVFGLIFGCCVLSSVKSNKMSVNNYA